MHRSLRIISTLMLLLAIMVMTGCATSPSTHFTNLQNDFFDISRVNVAGGPIGFGANIKATKLLELQYDDYDATGWDGPVGVLVYGMKVRRVVLFQHISFLCHMKTNIISMPTLSLVAVICLRV